MSDNDERIIAREDGAFTRAAEADVRIKSGTVFADWTAIGEGLAALRDRAMRESRSNRPFGRGYTRAYASLKAAHAWAGHYDPATASHAIWLHEQLSDVIRWRDTLEQATR